MNAKTKKKKYLIHQKLRQLRHDEYLVAKQKLPTVLNVNKRTFQRWMYLTLEDRLEIPADKLAILAKYFGCKMEDMFNYEIPHYNFSKLRNLRTDWLAREFNLVM